ncbi:hypothetical protein OBBRIDRAFT_107725 [Obba rivulosa]|uniref:Uncharacterized protein n=1 Tax=Obba rivulosa TaxID=1052685 RepID=A0A8E2DHG4_9APHY|nr:hypothetical protein OBBRIDRAFT_107725 [Obba rivulosa]
MHEPTTANRSPMYGELSGTAFTLDDHTLVHLTSQHRPEVISEADDDIFAGMSLPNVPVSGYHTYTDGTAMNAIYQDNVLVQAYMGYAGHTNVGILSGPESSNAGKEQKAPSNALVSVFLSI